uniref:HTH psq-type domain-containing protein n=1 Tax=Parascaris univalens TaxID=6257 RepID=A0A914ZRN8_PARUN
MANLLHPPEIRRRNQYNRSLLYDALKCVLRGKMNCHQASIRFKVPRSTIQRKLNLCREQHRLALELKLQKEMPSSSGEHPTESLREELFNTNRCQRNDTPTSINSLLLRNEEIYVPLSMHCHTGFKQRKFSASLYPVESIDADSSTGIEHLHNVVDVRCELVSEHEDDDNAIDAVALDQYSADQIDFCGEEHVIGDDLPITTDGISVAVDDGTIRVTDGSTCIPQEACSGAAMFYGSDTSTSSVDENFIDTNSVASRNQFTSVVDAVCANQMSVNDEVIYDEYMSVDELGNIIAPQQFIADVQLRFVEEDADTEEEELERAADRLSEAFRSVPSKIKFIIVSF